MLLLPIAAGRIPSRGLLHEVRFGPVYASFSGESDNGRAFIGGPATSLEISIGGTPYRGLVLAGSISLVSVSGEFEGAISSSDADAHMTSPFLGLLVDWFPAETGSWHLGGAVGLTGYSGRDGVDNRYLGSSVGGALFAGYDSWLGPHYSLGYALVGHAGLPSDSEKAGGDVGYRLTPLSLGLRLSLLYH